MFPQEVIADLGALFYWVSRTKDPTTTAGTPEKLHTAVEAFYNTHVGLMKQHGAPPATNFMFFTWTLGLGIEGLLACSPPRPKEALAAAVDLLRILVGHTDIPRSKAAARTLLRANDLLETPLSIPTLMDHHIKPMNSTETAVYRTLLYCCSNVNSNEAHLMTIEGIMMADALSSLQLVMLANQASRCC